ncbi:MAG: Glycerate kinase [Pedosphaera sp.]|nr:Glycerate kinase [Pedosphaera sp.]
MSLKVLIAPDKFKGTLTAPDAAAAIARGWRNARPADSLELLPMSDGGDGFGEVMSTLLGAKKIAVKTVDAAHRPIRAHWWWEPKSQTAIIESANVIGLAQLPAKKFHPFELDTYGLGAVIRAAAAKGAKRCFIGIGGSATNDGGFGVACALGWEFLDDCGNPIHEWTQLQRLAEVCAPKHPKWFEDFIVAVDVQNPLLGAHGCTRVYGPQKGLTPPDFPLAERCLRRLEMMSHRGRFMANEPGAGAAGGLGFGLRCFLRARLQPGFDLFARKAELAQRLHSADLVITGEGAIDPSTLMGKGVGQIAERCFKMKIPCLGLAGTVIPHPRAKKNLFTRQHGLTELTGADDAKQNAAHWLERLAEKIAQGWLEK